MKTALVTLLNRIKNFFKRKPPTISPPDLGVSVSDGVRTGDRFGG